MCSIWIEDGSAQTWMPDTVLRGKGAGSAPAGDSTITEITETNIATLTTLNAVGTTGNKISDLTGLEKATSLTTLRLQSNSISDISPLAGLTSLTDLRLYSNKISDISPLKNLSSLIQVWLQGNTNLSDISALSVKAKAGQPAKLSLNQVWLQATKVTDISPLEGAFDPHWANAVLGMPNTIYATDTNIAILMSMISDGPQHFYFHSTQYIKNFVNQPGIPLTADAWRELLRSEPPPPPPPPSADALRIVETDPVTNESLTVKRINDRTVTLSWNIPTSINARTITEFQYSIDGGQTWISTGSTNTSITITGDGFGNLSRDKFKIRSLSLNADGTALVVTAIISAPSKRIIISQCPVGWVRGSVVGQSKKAMIYEVKVDVDLTNRSSIYTLKSLAIYVHPDEGLETLEGWYLTTGPLYNHNPSRKFHLTAENSVIDEQGFAHIRES